MMFLHLHHHHHHHLMMKMNGTPKIKVGMQAIMKMAKRMKKQRRYSLQLRTGGSCMPRVGLQMQPSKKMASQIRTVPHINVGRRLKGNMNERGTGNNSANRMELAH